MAKYVWTAIGLLQASFWLYGAWMKREDGDSFFNWKDNVGIAVLCLALAAAPWIWLYVYPV